MGVGYGTEAELLRSWIAAWHRKTSPAPTPLPTSAGWPKRYFLQQKISAMLESVYDQISFITDVYVQYTDHPSSLNALWVTS